MMDKKTILVVVGCLIALLASQLVVNKIYPPKPKSPRLPATAVTNAAASATAIPNPVAKPAEATPARESAVVEPKEPRPAEQTITLSNNYVRMEFTSWGGGVKEVELLKHKANGHGQVVLNGKDFVPALALTGVTNAGPDTAYTIEQLAPNTVVMKRRTSTGLEITKTFNLGDAYLLSNTVEIVRASPAAATLPGPVGFVIGTATPVSTKEVPSFLTASWLAGEKYQYRDVNLIAKNAGKGITGEAITARWGAVNDQFFTKILTPGTNALAIEYKHVELTPPPDWSAKQPPQGVSATLKFPPTAITADTAERYEFTWYAGPKEYERLEALRGGQEEAMQFGFWGVISVVLLKSMKFFYKLIPNYGVSIIIITILIKVLFWPIQAKSIKSMKAMQKFQPLMNKLREKYKDDAQRLNSEMMKLYKEHKINPFAGCLPMVVQIPVFFALFSMLRSAIELRGASFLWIRDLSSPDTLFHVAGFPINLLPLLMTSLSIWQMKITPQTGDQQQQKMMMFMPLMMLFFFYSTSAGLVLYWTVQQFLSIAQQWWGMRQPDNATTGGPPVSTGKAK
jgi:YidC/Oxa1 family membrane protein insertase